jgi:hypothetical protein
MRLRNLNLTEHLQTEEELNQLQAHQQTLKNAEVFQNQVLETFEQDLKWSWF